MDRSWMLLPDKFCPEYITGVTSFMNVATNHTREDKKAPYPYRRCRNYIGIPYQTFKIIYTNMV